MYTRESWPAEALRRAVEAVRSASEGERHAELIGAAARVADYVAAGALVRAEVETALLGAADAAGMQKRKDGARDVRRCIAHGLGKGDPDKAWYPASGMNGEPLPRTFRWVGGRILELKPIATKKVADAIPAVPLLRHDFPVTHFSDRFNTQGEVEIWTWDILAEAVSDPLSWPERGKDALPLWSWAEYEDHSRADRPDGLDDQGRERKRPPTIDAVHALVLDYDDDPSFSLEQVARWWGAVRHVVHTSGSHLVAKGKKGALPRGRVIVALSRAVSEEEYRSIARWVQSGARGQPGEAELKNPRRAYFVPARGPGGYEQRANLVDRALDVDAILHRTELAAKTEEERADATAPQEDLLARLHTRKDGTPLPSLRNLVEVLDGDARWTGRFTRCEFSRRDLLDTQPVNDAAEVELAVWLAEVYGIDVGADRVHQALLAVCARHPVHPVREYLDGLTWDGEDRLEAWLRYAGCDPAAELAPVFGAKWMISAVARVYEPGCQADSVLILAGAQGFGKTSTFRILAGMLWHSESSLPIGDRDAYQQLDGVWIYELAELDSLRRSEMSSVKAYITTKVDKFRPSYGRNTIERARQNVFGGTTNDEQFLPDAGRRWWVVRVVQAADLLWLQNHRDQLWAEAVHRYRAGERWWLEGDERAAQEVAVETFRHHDPWEEPVRAWLRGQAETTAADVLTQAVKRAVEQQTRGDEMRVAELMKLIGWTKRINWKGRAVWKAPAGP